MAKTVGERAREEAEAFKARAWFRDVAASTYGQGEYYASDGTRLKMRHELREGRTDQRMGKVRWQVAAEGWRCIDSIAWLCTIHFGDGQEEEIARMLEALKLQVPDIFTWHDAPAEAVFPAFDCEAHALGSLRTDAALMQEMQLEDQGRVPAGAAD